MIESICSLIYNNKQGINYSANDLQSTMNIGNQLYSRLSQLTRRSFLMHKELPAVLNVFKTDCDFQINIVKAKLVPFIKKLQ